MWTAAVYHLKKKKGFARCFWESKQIASLNWVERFWLKDFPSVPSVKKISGRCEGINTSSTREVIWLNPFQTSYTGEVIWLNLSLTVWISHAPSLSRLFSTFSLDNVMFRWGVGVALLLPFSCIIPPFFLWFLANSSPLWAAHRTMCRWERWNQGIINALP